MASLWPKHSYYWRIKIKSSDSWKECYYNIEVVDPKHVLEPVGKLIIISAFADADQAENIVTLRRELLNWAFMGLS